MKMKTKIEDLTAGWQKFIAAHRADVDYWLSITGDIARAAWLAEITQSYRQPYDDLAQATALAAHYPTDRASRLDDTYTILPDGVRVLYRDRPENKST